MFIVYGTDVVTYAFHATVAANTNLLMLQERRLTNKVDNAATEIADYQIQCPILSRIQWQKLRGW